jgi:hypothetical protein
MRRTFSSLSGSLAKDDCYGCGRVCDVPITLRLTFQLLASDTFEWFDVVLNDKARIMPIHRH